jgi:hypothetical protein
MSKYLYRFKTRKEFREEFGEDFENNPKIKCGWCSVMNRFLGKDFELITSLNVNNFPKDNQHITTDYYGWSISWDMIVLKNNNPTYLPKKLSYE